MGTQGGEVEDALGIGFLLRALSPQLKPICKKAQPTTKTHQKKTIWQQFRLPPARRHTPLSAIEEKHGLDSCLKIG